MYVNVRDVDEKTYRDRVWGRFQEERICEECYIETIHANQEEDIDDTDRLDFLLAKGCAEGSTREWLAREMNDTSNSPRERVRCANCGEMCPTVGNEYTEKQYKLRVVDDWLVQPKPFSCLCCICRYEDFECDSRDQTVLAECLENACEDCRGNIPRRQENEDDDDDDEDESESNDSDDESESEESDEPSPKRAKTNIE